MQRKPRRRLRIFFLSLAVSLALLSRCFEHCARVILAPKKSRTAYMTQIYSHTDSHTDRCDLGAFSKKRPVIIDSNISERVKGLSELYDCKI